MADRKATAHEQLNYIQTRLKAPKNQYNNFGKYKYRSCEDILEGVKPLLGDCTLTISDRIEQVGDRLYVVAAARLSDGKNNIEVEAYAREALTKKGMDEAQVTGACSSYARKYALNALFCIDDTKDADSNDNRPQPAIKKPAIKPVDNSKKLVTAAQLKRMFAIKNTKDLSDDDLKKYIHAGFGKESTKELTQAEYDEIIKFIAAMPDK